MAPADSNLPTRLRRPPALLACGLGLTCARVLNIHPHTLASRNNLANAYRAEGRLDQAVLLLERTLADRERVLGETHPSTLA